MATRSEAVDARPRLGARDGVVAAALAGAFVLLFRAWEQRWLWTDGLLLGAKLEWDEPGLWPHPAYLPVVRALDALGEEPGPYDGLLAASWLPGGVAVAFAYLVARALGASAAGALFGALALALTPAFAFFATTVEVHALHAAAVGGAAFVALRAPWRRPGLAITCTAAAFLAVALTHLFAALLGLGWLALCAHAARASGAPLTARRVGWQLAPALVVCGLVALALDAWGFWSTQELGVVDGTIAQIERDRQASSLAWWIEDVVRPLHAAWAPVALGALVLAVAATRDALARSLLVALVVLAAPLTAFTAWFAVPNEGGYLLGLAPFLAALAALGADAVRRRARGGVALALAALVLVPLARAGFERAHAWRDAHESQHRAARELQVRRALPGGGVLVSFDLEGQPIGLDVAGVRERHVLRVVLDALREGTDPAATASAVAERVEGALDLGVPVALDLVHRRIGAVNPYAAPYAAALDVEFARRFLLDELDHPLWPLARVARRP